MGAARRANHAHRRRPRHHDVSACRSRRMGRRWNASIARRASRRMMFVRALLAAVALVAAPRVAVAGTTCVPAQLAPSAYPVLLVKARVNGNGPYTFFVDTGATVSIISTSLAAKLQLRQLPTPVHGVGAGGRFTAHAS